MWYTIRPDRTESVFCKRQESSSNCLELVWCNYIHLFLVSLLLSNLCYTIFCSDPKFITIISNFASFFLRPNVNVAHILEPKKTASANYVFVGTSFLYLTEKDLYIYPIINQNIGDAMYEAISLLWVLDARTTLVLNVNDVLYIFL